MNKSNDKTTEQMILAWVRKAQSNGELKHNPFHGKKLSLEGGCAVTHKARQSAISTLSSVQTTYPAAAR